MTFPILNQRENRNVAGKIYEFEYSPFSRYPIVVAVSGWLYWLVISKLVSISDVGQSITVYSLVVLTYDDSGSRSGISHT